MNPHYTYLLILAGAFSFPFLFSFEKKLSFYKWWKQLFPGLAITAIVFIAWDILFTAQGVWWFSRQYTLSFRPAGLPIEEWLFFLIIPYCCVFIHASLGYYYPSKGVDTGWQWFLVMGIVLIAFAALNYHRAYTFFACLSCGVALLVARQIKARNPLFRADRFLLTYAVCLVPFLIVNGLLTAIPVVLYNDAENTGIRIHTIPAEDIIYGMLLILANVWSTTYLLARSNIHGGMSAPKSSAPRK
jgi:lycopene cyclase domain-containing protein